MSKIDMIPRAFVVGLILLFVCCSSPNESKYLSVNEAEQIVFSNVLHEDTTGIVQGLISEKIVPANTEIVGLDPKVMSPEFTSYVAQLSYGATPDTTDDPGRWIIKWVFIHAETGEWSVEDHWYMYYNSNLLMIPFL